MNIYYKCSDIGDYIMRHYCSSENYFSVDEIERILASDSVEAFFYPNLYKKTFTIQIYLFGVFLGSTRTLKRIPKQSKCPRIVAKALSNRIMAENFQ